MLRPFRRGSKMSLEDASLTPTVTNSIHEELADSPPAQTLSFFSLPAEIRNAIYEFVITDTTLTIPSTLATAKKLKLPLRRRKAIETPINGLLLASRQCRREYLSTLFSCGLVVVEVKDFDFEGVIKASSNLDELEVQSLQSNRNLTIQLITQNCRPKDSLALRRWLDHLQDCRSRLPWKYDVPLEKLRPPTTMGGVRLLRELTYYADGISPLSLEIDESQNSDLQAIIGAFHKAIDELSQDLGYLSESSKIARSQLRGLPGGGVF